MNRRLLVAPPLLCLALTLAPAQAAHPTRPHAVTHVDPTHDVARLEGGRTSSSRSTTDVDITRERVDHTAHDIVLTLRVVDLRNERFSARVQYAAEGRAHRTTLDVTNSRSGVDFRFELDDGAMSLGDTAGTSVLADFRHDRLVVTLPSRVLHDPAWVRVGAALSVDDHGATLTDLSNHGRAASDPAQGDLPLGPRAYR